MTEIQLSYLFPHKKVINPFKIKTNVPDNHNHVIRASVKFHNVDGAKFSCVGDYLTCPLCEMGHEIFITKHFDMYFTDEGIHSVLADNHDGVSQYSMKASYIAAVDKRYNNPFGSKVFKLMRVSPPDLILGASGWFAQLKQELQLISKI